jgi:hypothetical protein
MHFEFGHLLCMCHAPDLLDLPDTGSAIGFKYKAKNLRDEIVEFSTIIWIFECSTIGTRRIAIFQTT